NLVLFVDRGSPHTARRSRELAAELGVELRFLPTACPELNPVEGLWRHVKGRGDGQRAHPGPDRRARPGVRRVVPDGTHRAPPTGRRTIRKLLATYLVRPIYHSQTWRLLQSITGVVALVPAT